MEIESSVPVAASVNRTVEVFADLGTHPDWNLLVASAQRTDPNPSDPGPAWDTVLQAKLGPFQRSKQLRFVRVDPHDQEVVFERFEVDGRDHSDWMMQARVTEHEKGSEVTIKLHYSGNLWVAALDPIIEGAVKRSAEQLSDYIENTPESPAS